MYKCEVCSRDFSRKQNLEWHLAGQGHKGMAALSPKENQLEVSQNMVDDSYCPGCYEKDRVIDKKDRDLESAAMSLGNLQGSYKELANKPEPAAGHTSLVDLLACPTHAQDALTGYEGIVVPPGTITPDTAASLKRLVPMLGEGIDIDLSGVHGIN